MIIDITLNTRWGPYTLTQADIERWKAKIACPDGLLGCWEWTGSGIGAGRYAGLWIQFGPSLGFMIPATHITLAIAGKPVPEGMLARHLCPKPNKRCVAPHHLTYGTPRQNRQDYVEYKRKTEQLLIGAGV